MDWQTIVVIIGALASLTTVASFYNTKLKDAEQSGILKQRVSELEAKQEENKATKADINSLLLAVGRITEQIDGLQRSVEELKIDMKCIERRKE
jgi:peptidoglycan hydrolase CwlO-like protein